jgi:hypothetical protein
MRLFPTFNSSLMFFGAVLWSAASIPALADDHQLGAVNVSAYRYTHVSWSRFDGPVVRLQFVADTDSVKCEHIIVTYHDGTSHDVFSGTLAKDSTETITFPEGDSRIRNVDFACKAMSVDGARITISAVSEGVGLTSRDDDGPRSAHVLTKENIDPN